MSFRRGPPIAVYLVVCLVVAVIAYVVVRGSAICSVTEPEHMRCVASASSIAFRTATTAALVSALILLLGTLLRSFVKRR